ncbi:MAG: DUF937 domain-containing protein [Hyphomicrobiaceae bacterium]
MNSIIDTLKGAQDGQLFKNVARQFDSPTDQTEVVIATVVKELADKIDLNTLSNGGLSDLIRALGEGHHQDYLDNPEAITGPEVQSDGNAILSHITGSKHASRRLAARAARETEVDAGTIENMLPVVAAMMMGGLSKTARGPLGEIMQKMQIGSGQSIQSAISENANIGQHQPLPVPGDHVPGLGRGKSSNPFEDFSDVIRGGRKRVPRDVDFGNGDGSTLWRLVRSIIGSALGLRGSSGVMGWIIRFFIYKYGWRIVSGIFRRLILGR